VGKGSRFKKLGQDMEDLKIPQDLGKFVPEEEVIPSPKGFTEANELMEKFNIIINLIFRAWQYHFQYLNLAYLAYLMFMDTARKLFPGIKDSTIGKMVAGADVSVPAWQRPGWR
jgi:pyruvate,water dikinase